VAARKLPLYRHLYFQVVCAILIGILLGHFYPTLAVKMQPLGEAFIKTIKMLIAPIIFCTVVHGIASMNDMKKVGRVGLKAIIYFEVVTTLALMRRPESTARKVSTWAGGLGLLAFLGFYFALPVVTKPAALGWVLSVLWPNMNTLVFLPIFGILTAWMGTRRPYSSYEYLLNECYQCGKCHTVCPVTKVEDDALGGLNLVYNTFKKQHDGVPLWTCLACDACSAVCPLDIQYSDYILEERAKVHAKMAADGGQKE